MVCKLPELAPAQSITNCNGLKKGIKITASGEQKFRLRGCPEDDTIILFEDGYFFWGYSGRSGVGSTGSVFF